MKKMSASDSSGFRLSHPDLEQYYKEIMIRRGGNRALGPLIHPASQGLPGRYDDLVPGGDPIPRILNTGYGGHG